MTEVRRGVPRDTQGRAWRRRRRRSLRGEDSVRTQFSPGAHRPRRHRRARCLWRGIRAVDRLAGHAGAGHGPDDDPASPYDADDPAYHATFCTNSSGGSGHRDRRRITGLAADAAGRIYAAGADGGDLAIVDRRRGVDAHRRWPRASLSSGALETRQRTAPSGTRPARQTQGGTELRRQRRLPPWPTTDHRDPDAGQPGRRRGGSSGTTINAVRFTADQGVDRRPARRLLARAHRQHGDPVALRRVRSNPTFLPGGASTPVTRTRRI